jgi:hypothetical protein
MIRDIYSSASRVRILLGEEEGDSDLAFPVLAAIIKDGFESILKPEWEYQGRY